jgi:tetratricopeptide (TPR) repeat protein
LSLSTERKQLLAEAHRARNAGRARRAIALYKQLLREDPRNIEVALRAAPLLARRGEEFEAWQLYRSAARLLARERHYRDCLAVYHEACRYVPHEYDAWRLRAELELKLGREGAAFETLLDGRTQFRDVRTRAQAIALLTRARSIEPWDPEVVLDLARLYSRTDQTDAALELLAAVATRCDAEAARRVRSLQWRITLSPRYAWLWLQSWWNGIWLREPTETPLVRGRS